MKTKWAEQPILAPGTSTKHYESFNMKKVFRNAMIYNLSKISQKIHLLENIIEEIFKEENNDIIFKIEKINELIQGIYELQGITNRYLKSAKGVFSIDFGAGLKLKESLK